MCSKHNGLCESVQSKGYDLVNDVDIAAQLEKVMKALFLRRLYLWPRFEATAKEVLDAIEKDIEVSKLRFWCRDAIKWLSLPSFYCQEDDLVIVHLVGDHSAC